MPVQGASEGTSKPIRLQGQYLAYIRIWAKIHGRPPSENEIAAFSRLRGPSAHRMIPRLEGCGCVARTPEAPRTLRILLPRAEIPDRE